jgi:hypothetical protein
LRFLWQWLWRMPFSGMWYHLALVRTDISDEHITSIIKMERIKELGWTLAVTSNGNTNRCYLLLPLFLFPDSFHPDGRCDTFLWNVSSNKSHMALHPRRCESSGAKFFLNRRENKQLYVILRIEVKCKIDSTKNEYRFKITVFNTMRHTRT